MNQKMNPVKEADEKMNRHTLPEAAGKIRQNTIRTSSLERQTKEQTRWTAAVLTCLMTGNFAGCSMMEVTEDYYTRVNNQSLQQHGNSSVIDLSKAGAMDYTYDLPCYNAKGENKTCSFGVPEPLEEGESLKLENKPGKQVHQVKQSNPNEVKMTNEVTRSDQIKYQNREKQVSHASKVSQEK